MAKTIGITENTDYLKAKIKDLENEVGRLKNNNKYEDFIRLKGETTRKINTLERKNNQLIEYNTKLTEIINELKNNCNLLEQKKQETKEIYDDIINGELQEKNNEIQLLKKEIEKLTKRNVELQKIKSDYVYERTIRELNRLLHEQKEQINNLSIRIQMSENLTRVGDTIDSLTDKDKERFERLGGIKWLKDKIRSTKLKTKQR